MTTSNDINSEHLRESIRHALNGEAVLFLGAGVCKIVGGKKEAPLPTGPELSKALGHDCGINELYNLEDIAQHFIDIKSETALINALRRHLTVESISQEFKTIVNLPWRRIWTTNYDDAVEQTLGNSFHKSVTIADDVANAKGSSLVVVHINGMLSRIRQSITTDFIITSEHYSTDHFNKSEWATIFRNDVRTARSLFFIGYSLHDLDVARVLHSATLMKGKTIFVDRTGTNKILESKVNRFGTLYEIGAEGFAAHIASESRCWVKPDLVEQFDYWRIIKAAEPTRSTTDANVYDLVLKGIAKRDLLAAQSESPDDVQYNVVRDCESICIDHLGTPSSAALITGGFANGKTLTTESISLQLAASGRDVIALDRSSSDAPTELTRMCRRDDSFVLIIENYSRNLELVRLFCQLAREDCSILITEKTEIHELRGPALADSIGNRTLRVFELDALSKKEISRFSKLLDLRGLWGERTALKEHQKAAFLYDDCRGQVNALMLEVIRSPEIQRRLKEIVVHFDSVEGGSNFLIAICLLQVIGELPRVDVAAELLQLSSEAFKKLTSDPIVKSILSVNSGIADFRSPVVADAVLEGFSSAGIVTKVAVICAKNGHLQRRADSLLGQISIELMRFANLERVLPKAGRSEALQNFYQDLKSIDSIRANALFWLQYAMAQLSIGELETARRHFENSYSIASASDFDTFQIDNHYCRLLLAEAEKTPDAEVAFQKVDEVLGILKRQVLREHRHYPYRSSWQLVGVVKRHGERWSNSQRSIVSGACQYLLNSASRLDARVARSTAVSGAISRLNDTITELSEKND